MSKDALGERMKTFYENRYKTFLPRRSFVLIRLDGRSFHRYTKGLDRPFDTQFMHDMGETAKYLCEEIDGARLAYTQSDEISVLVTDFATEKTQAWFDNNQQKIVSISTSLATAKFNQERPGKLACFDSRAFAIPEYDEVVRYFCWRQQDSVRNSIAMAAQALYSANQLHGKSSGQQQEMMWQKGVNWNDYDPRFKRGTVVVNVTKTGSASWVDKQTGELRTLDGVARRPWEIQPAPNFGESNIIGDSLISHKDKVIDVYV